MSNKRDIKEIEVEKMPQKRFYRSRAHCNPLSHNDGFNYPTRPTDMNWISHYPKIFDPEVQIVGQFTYKQIYDFIYYTKRILYHFILS